ncbi:hypothetical protein M0813_03309 [Anaeramoeba flamelloides]|uniref:Uncharacterized protein n=1 Tax=Anaeramoeba flamelloides TaxID=1746091 RepID=A0ABQ8XZP9_9EUKA|nr:hypothetical protein M0813_03309 [Anaeramoeba flamelloides]
MPKRFFSQIQTKNHEQLLKQLNVSKEQFTQHMKSIKRWVVDELLEPTDHWILDLNSELSTNKTTANLILPTVSNYAKYQMINTKENKKIVKQNQNNKNIKELNHFIQHFGTETFEYISYRITQIIKSVGENNNFSELKSNSGARWNNKSFISNDPKLPTDSIIVALLLKIELELLNLPDVIHLETDSSNNRAFPVLKLYKKKLSQFAINYQKRDWLLEEGENNIFFALTLFFLIIKKNYNGILNGVNIIDNLFLSKRI